MFDLTIYLLILTETHLTQEYCCKPNILQRYMMTYTTSYAKCVTNSLLFVIVCSFKKYSIWNKLDYN